MSEQEKVTRAIAARSTQLAFTIREEMSLTSVADVFVKSGLFKDVRDQAQAIVKVLAGREMGMEPVQAMMSLYVVSGRVGVYAEALAAKIKADPDTRYKVLEHDNDVCSIQFYERVDGVWEECGPPSTFTAEEAKQAGTQNMGKFPRNMLFARALSNGFRWYCPHLKVPGMMTTEELQAIPAQTTRSDGALALEEALSKPVEEAPLGAIQPAVEVAENGSVTEAPPTEVPASAPSESKRKTKPREGTPYGDFLAAAQALKRKVPESIYYGKLREIGGENCKHANQIPPRDEDKQVAFIASLETAAENNKDEGLDFPPEGLFGQEKAA